MGRFFAFLIIVLDASAAVLTAVCGAVIIPNAIWLGLNGLDLLARAFEYLFSGLKFLPRMPVMTLPTLFTWDTWHESWGLIWLALYLITRLTFIVEALRTRSNAPANTAHPGEERWELVIACIKGYQDRLARLYPVPVKLRVPPGVKYTTQQNVSLITWQYGLPVFPMGLLVPATQPLLRPLLALELAKYNSADQQVKAVISLYPDFWPNGYLTVLLIWFWLPCAIKHSKPWKRWCFRRELAYDTFAYLCGEGETLLSILKTQEAANLQQYPNEFEPSTAERIGHLEALLTKEYAQMSQHDLIVPPMPGLLPLPLASFVIPEETLKEETLMLLDPNKAIRAMLEGPKRIRRSGDVV